MADEAVEPVKVELTVEPLDAVVPELSQYVQLECVQLVVPVAFVAPPKVSLLLVESVGGAAVRVVAVLFVDEAVAVVAVVQEPVAPVCSVAPESVVPVGVKPKFELEFHPPSFKGKPGASEFV